MSFRTLPQHVYSIEVKKGGHSKGISTGTRHDDAWRSPPVKQQRDTFRTNDEHSRSTGDDRPPTILISLTPLNPSLSPHGVVLVSEISWVSSDHLLRDVDPARPVGLNELEEPMALLLRPDDGFFARGAPFSLCWLSIEIFSTEDAWIPKRCRKVQHAGRCQEVQQRRRCPLLTRVSHWKPSCCRDQNRRRDGKSASSVGMLATGRFGSVTTSPPPI